MISREEKAQSIQFALQLSPDLSDREIAKQIGVSNGAVSRWRRRLQEVGAIIPRQSTHSAEACFASLCTSAIRPTIENDLLYDPIRRDDPAFVALRENVRENGILEPILVSADGQIISGHRRYAAAEELRMHRIPVRVRYDINYRTDRDGFLKLLASCNRQRMKSSLEQTREELALSDLSTREIYEFRRLAAAADHVESVRLPSRRKRSEIRDKRELKEAIVRTVLAERENWPLSDRAIHYRMLNIPGLVRNDKTRVPYLNDHASYNDVTSMLTRLRLTRDIPFESIADETRPVVQWDIHKSVGDYVRREVDGFLGEYWRDLQQSQSCWVELLVEKNTIASQLRGLAWKYAIPMTSGRGYSSLPPRKEMVDRYRESGRSRLVVLVVSDFDPEGEDIPSAFGVSLRDDFHVLPSELTIVKAALTIEQVRELALHEGQFSKEGSSRYKRFVQLYGNRCWELESLTMEQLRNAVELSIRAALDLEAFESEVARERSERQELAEIRQRLKTALLQQL